MLHPDVRPSFAAQPAGVLYAHVFAAAVALLVGPLQFSGQIRTRWPVLHRWLGRIYLAVGVLIGGVSGALLAWKAYGGPWSRAGFMTLALAWLATGAIAWLKIRRGEVEAHRRWMIRNFGLLLAAVSLRLGLPALVAGGVPMPVAYPLVAWLCWLPQAAWIEWRLSRGALSAYAAALWRWVTGALALTLLGGCATVQPARMSLPAELGERNERIELRGLGAGTQGSATVLGRTLSFERSASRLSLFDDLVRTDRSALQWRWRETDTVRADCRSRRRSNTVGLVDIVGRPFHIDSRFEPGGSLLTLAETWSSRSRPDGAIGTLAGGIAHDFNNILAAILCIERRLDGADAAVLGDPTQVHQVVMNLCANAVQAMRSQGTAQVTLDRASQAEPGCIAGNLPAGDCVRLRVSDTGVGIAPQVLERIFDPFFTTKGVGVGTGLGLSLVHGIVTDLGGGIDVQSELGVGSTFTIFLPWLSSIAAPVLEAATVPSGGGETVLLVDDEEALVRLGEELVAELGYEPGPALELHCCRPGIGQVQTLTTARYRASKLRRLACARWLKTPNLRAP